MSARGDGEKQQRVNLDVSHDNFPVNVHFNRYAIIKDGDVFFLQFAYLLLGRIQNVVTVSMCLEELKRNKERLLGYMGKASSEAAAANPFSFFQTDNVISEVKMINAARGGNSSELSLFTFSMHGAMDIIREKKAAKLPVSPIARLCSETPIQTRFLLDLFSMVEE